MSWLPWLLFFVAAETLTVPKTLYERCVEKSDFVSCYELADLYQRTSQKNNKLLGNKYALYGCKLEKKRKCSFEEATTAQLATLKTKKNWTAESEKLILKLETLKTEDEVKCESGDAAACLQAGLHYQFLKQGPVNPEKAKALYEAGCKLGNRDCCSSFDLINKGIVKVYDVDL